jgi:murein DD-endopeptidase MepM/ murein hydrolase activator NlpD
MLMLMVALSNLGVSWALEVVPGGVVVWPGSGVERCTLGERSFAPRDGACTYPVDLLTAPGPLALGRVRDGRAETAEVTVARYPYPTQELTVEPRMVDLSPADLARSEREQARVKALWELAGEPRFTLPLGRPLAGTASPTNFGARRVFNGEPRSPHTGVDFKAKQGTPVVAVERGRVVLAEEHFFAGRSVFVDHGGGLVSMYFHLDRIAVAVGQELERGATVGTVGATGRATGPHLHFGLRWHGARVDPRLLFVPPERLPSVP